MNPSVSCCTSSEEQGGEAASWVCESWALGNPAMSVGTLENARQTFHGGAAGRVDWDWDMNITATNNNPLLLSSHHRHHHHHHHHDHHDSDEHKPHLMSPASAPSFRQYNGVMGPFSGHQNNALGFLNSSGIRSFEGSNDGMNPPGAPSSSFHPSLLYSEMPGFGAGGFGCSDSRSQLLGMMSMQQQHQQQQAEHHHHHHKEVGFHDIVKREELCPGEFQARIGLNLGHRTYFSAEDTAVSRLYKRPRAIPPASQVPRCQAEGCKADLTNAKHYHRRHKVCEFHSKATCVLTGGVQQRFCQQCSRFHVLAEFDEVKRSCRKRLADHNRRRRKPQTNAIVPAVSSAEAATALKAEDDDNNVSGSCNNTSRGTVQTSAAAAPVLRTEAQTLLNAMSLPLILQNTKGSQMNTNNNTNTSNNNNPMLQQPSSQKVPVANQQYVQQQQSGGGHKGPNLSLSSSSVGMSLCNQRQTTTQDYSGLELALPWLRTTSEYSGSSNRPTAAMENILHPIISHEKANVEAFSASSVQNFLPLTGSMSSRDLGSSQWMVGSSDSASSLEAGQQMFSLLEPAEHQNRTEEQPQTARPVEYLSHRHQGVLNSKEPVDGNSEAKFSEMQHSLRPFGQSIYDGNM